MREPAVTVVIPTYNRLDLIRETIESVRAQDGSWELIVVDDASTDGTRAWVEGLGDPRVRGIWRTERGERAVARNEGAAEARGRFLLFLDNDDLLAPGALARLSGALDAAPGAVAAVGAAVAFDEDGNRRRLPHPRRRVLWDAWRDAIVGWTLPPGAALFRAGVVREVGGFTTEFVTVDDQGLWLRVAARGPALFVPETVLHHRMHRGQSRSHSHTSLHRALREAYVATLSGERRAAAARAMRVRQGLEDGWFAWRRNDRRGALRLFLGAARADPSILRSPLMGGRVRSLLARSAAGALLGGRATAGAQRLVWRVRSRLRRAPGGADAPIGPDAVATRPDDDALI